MALPFRPLVRSRHLQTILPAFLPQLKFAETTEMRVMLADGDILSCDVAKSFEWTEKSPTLVLIHGLGGSASSKYMQRLTYKATCKGFQVVSVNLRGCGSGRGLAKKPYSAGVSDDIVSVLYRLKEKHPTSPIALVGFSLGANITLKLNAEKGASLQDILFCSIAISPPFDLHDSVQLIQKRSNGLYHRYYLKKF
jgi:uncharacterized protein